jgi:hypothetical protein
MPSVQVVESTHKLHGFALVMEGMPDFHMGADTEREFKDWINALRESIRRSADQTRSRTQSEIAVPSSLMSLR